MASTTDATSNLPSAAVQAIPDVTNLGREVAAWVSGLRGWKRLAAELVAVGVPSPSEVDRLFRVFMSEHGLKSPDATGCVSAGTRDVAQTARSRAPDLEVYRVKSVRHVSGINRLPANTCLEFGTDTNLSIIYGPNASGKSGYFRILKACSFTRTSGDLDILGDAWAEEEVPKEALIELRTADGRTITVAWHEGSSIERLRERVAVFDATSVRAHLDERNSLVFAPSGLEIFSRMAAVYADLKGRLDAEIRVRSTPLKIALPSGSSRVSVLLAELGSKSSVEELKKLAAFGDAEAQELAALEKQVTELSQVDPADLRGKLDRKSKRLSALVDAFARSSEQLSSTSVDRIVAAREKLKLLEQEAEIASNVQFAAEPLQPIGTRAWLELLAAATRYGREAYPGVAYPSGAVGERCVLCQQTLDGDAARRMKNFWASTDARVRQEVARQKGELQVLIDAVASLEVSIFASESSAMAELDSTVELKRLVAEAGSAIARRRAWVLAAGSDVPPPLPDVTVIDVQLRALLAEQRAALTRLAAEDRETILATLRQKQCLLSHRKYLSSVMDDVESEIERLRWNAIATRAASSLKTTEISSKQRSLTENLLKADYATRLSAECRELGFELPVDIRLSGASGVAVRAVQLAGAAEHTSPSRVLSEGEQRALALADFLTEAAIASEFECLIFDDPVTSHDHERKQKVADRLVRESKDRQVVIFTHDRVFIAYLLAAVRSHALTAACGTIGRRGHDDAPGFPGAVVFPEPTFERSALQEAERLLAAARTQESREQLDAVEAGLGHVRTAYEEFIQHDLFGGVVNRWVEQIRWMNLEKVFFDADTVRAVQARLEGLSRYISAHSHSTGFQEALPTVKTLEAEINWFKSTQKEYSAKKKEFRASLPKSPLA